MILEKRFLCLLELLSTLSSKSIYSLFSESGLYIWILTSIFFLFQLCSCLIIPVHYISFKLKYSTSWLELSQEISICLTVFHSQHFKLSFFFKIFISLLNYSFKFCIIFLLSLNCRLKQVLIFFFNLIAHIHNQLWRADEIHCISISVSRTPVTQTHAGKPFPIQKDFCWSTRGCWLIFDL